MRAALLQVKSELGDDAVIMSNKKVAGGVELVAAMDGDAASNQARTKVQEPKQVPQSNVRQLDDDRVSLGSKNSSGRTMTNRFANMLKQYSGNSQADIEDIADDQTDSLSGLLKRQNNYKDQNEGVKLREGSPLARLIAEDNSRFKSNSSPHEHSRRDDVEVKNNDLEEMREEMTSIRQLLEHQVSGLMWQEVERREPLRAMLIKRLERMGVSSDLADQLACYIPEDTAPTKAWRALLGLSLIQI